MRKMVDVHRDDAGFTLVEVIVALTLLGVVATGCLVFFIQGTSTASALQRKQSAVALASQALDVARSYKPADLLKGRTAADVHTQWVQATAPDEARTYEASDSPTSPARTPTIAYAVTPRVSNQTYTVNTLVGTCYRALTTTSECTRIGTAAPTATPAGYVQLYRVIVEVSWSTRGQASGCVDGLCVYRASTLIDPTIDPTWNVRAAPIPNTTPRVVPAQKGTATAVDLKVVAQATNVDENTQFVVQSTDVGAAALAVDGAAYVDPGNVRGKVLTFKPPLATLGTSTLTYYLVNGDGQTSASSTLTVRVVPVATNDVKSIPRGTSATVAFGANDIPSDLGTSVVLDPGSFAPTAGACTAGTPDAAGNVAIRAQTTPGTCVFSYALRGTGANSGLVSDAGSITVTVT